MIIIAPHCCASSFVCYIGLGSSQVQVQGNSRQPNWMNGRMNGLSDTTVLNSTDSLSTLHGDRGMRILVLGE